MGKRGACARGVEEFPHGRLVAVSLPAGVTGHLAELLGEDIVLFDPSWRLAAQVVATIYPEDCVLIGLYLLHRNKQSSSYSCSSSSCSSSSEFSPLGTASRAVAMQCLQVAHAWWRASWRPVSLASSSAKPPHRHPLGGDEEDR